MTQSKLRSWIKKVDNARTTYSRGDLCVDNMVILLIGVKDELEDLKADMLEEYYKLKQTSANRYQKKLEKPKQPVR